MNDSIGLATNSLSRSHPAYAVVRTLYEAVGTLDVDTMLSLLDTSELEAWHAALLHSPHHVWKLQSYRDIADMPVTDIPTTLAECMRYALEAIRAYERQRLPNISAIRALENGVVQVELSLVPRGDEDPDLGVEVSQPFVVDVRAVATSGQEHDDTWKVVSFARGAFPLPGLVWGLMYDIVEDGDTLSLEIRTDYAADATNAAELEQWLREQGCQLTIADAKQPGWRALSVVVPAASSAEHLRTLLSTMRTYPVVRQVWRTYETD